MSLISMTCEKLLFLAVSIFRHAILGSVLLAVPYTLLFIFSYVLGLIFLTCLFLAVLLLASVGATQCDMSQKVKAS
jgi:hypothetical protein